METHGFGTIKRASVNLSSDKKRLLFRLSATTPDRPLPVEFEMDVSLGKAWAEMILAVSQRASVKPVKRKGKPSLRVVPND